MDVRIQERYETVSDYMIRCVEDVLQDAFPYECFSLLIKIVLS